MITYKITSKSTQTKPSVTSVDPKDARFEKILRKASTKAFKIFPLGCTVRMKGSQRHGTVMGIRTDPSACSWKGEKPYFINVKFHDDLPANNVLAHSSSLERVANK